MFGWCKVQNSLASCSTFFLVTLKSNSGLCRASLTATIWLDRNARFTSPNPPNDAWNFAWLRIFPWKAYQLTSSYHFLHIQIIVGYFSGLGISQHQIVVCDIVGRKDSDSVADFTRPPAIISRNRLIFRQNPNYLPHSKIQLILACKKCCK